jgi:hypothetical protein
MGGRGSGRRWHFEAKDTTNDYRALDVRRLQREGLLAPGRAFGWNWLRNNETVASIQVRTEADRIILSYRHRSGEGEWKSEEYPVWLDWTPCTYGGRRAWFICPARGCGKRAAVLYGGGIFACRHCYRLAYLSQRESADDRAARRADRIRARLGWELGILNGSGWKPKGMHWKTFERLKAEHDALVEIALAGMARRLGLLQARLDGFLEK